MFRRKVRRPPRRLCEAKIRVLHQCRCGCDYRGDDGNICSRVPNRETTSCGADLGGAPTVFLIRANICI